MKVQVYIDSPAQVASWLESSTSMGSCLGTDVHCRNSYTRRVLAIVNYDITALNREWRPPTKNLHVIVLGNACILSGGTSRCACATGWMRQIGLGLMDSARPHTE